MREITVLKNDAGQRADRFLKKILPSLSIGRLYKYIRQKDIKLNGRRLEISDRLKEGDVIKLYVPDEFFSESCIDTDAPAYNLSLGEVKPVYEDKNIMIVYKPSGLVVHEDSANSQDTLIARLKAYLISKGEYSPDAEQSFAPALCNRIDRNTEGLVICAKNAKSLRAMNEIIKQHRIEKSYLCVTVGTPRDSEGTIKTYLEKAECENTVYVRHEKTPASKTAITEYRVIDTSGGLSLCEVRLVTGRTHQIRVHMAYIGCPLLGDGKYGRNEANRHYKESSQCLSAYKIAFKISDVNSPLYYLNNKEFTAPEPDFVKKYFPSRID